jgi:hypothetical protein
LKYYFEFKTPPKDARHASDRVAVKKLMESANNGEEDGYMAQKQYRSGLPLRQVADIKPFSASFNAVLRR